MISVVGVTHKTAPLEVRERFAFSNRTAVGILRSVPFEAFLLVTCNRCELYGTAAATVLRQVLLDAAGAPGQTPLMAHEGPAAVRH
ncbi:MAG: glutamyl-tRNA reductase, partial [Armatimonadota bacterium]|nr:glutamyl-tRNA reductase [Armatimonadota bacterium]